MKIYVACIDHRYGTDMYADRTEEGLYAKLSLFCRQWWETDGPKGEPAPDNRELVQAYFEHQSERGEEWYRTDEIEIGEA